MQGWGVEEKDVLLVAAATDPLTRKKRSGDVLLVGGLALGYLTSEVRACQRKGHFLWSEPRGLDETLGWRESVPGEGVAPQGGESLPAAGEELGAARSGNTEQLLGSSACPPSPGATRPASCVAFRRQARGPWRPPLPAWSELSVSLGSASVRVACVPGALDHLLLFYGAWELFLPSSTPPLPAPPGHRVPCQRWAASQPRCQRSELKCSLLFKAYFLAPGPA